MVKVLLVIMYLTNIYEVKIMFMYKTCMKCINIIPILLFLSNI